MMMPPPPAPVRPATTAAGPPGMSAAAPPRPALPSAGSRNGLAGTKRRSSEWTADALGRILFQGEQLRGRVHV